MDNGDVRPEFHVVVDPCPRCGQQELHLVREATPDGDVIELYMCSEVLYGNYVVPLELQMMHQQLNAQVAQQVNVIQTMSTYLCAITKHRGLEIIGGKHYLVIPGRFIAESKTGMDINAQQLPNGDVSITVSPKGGGILRPNGRRQ